MVESVTEGARVAFRQRQVKRKCLVEGVRLVVASLAADLAAQSSTKHLEYRCLSLGLDDVFAGGLAAVGGLNKMVQVQGKELVGVTLLSQSVPVPDGLK